MGLQIRKFEVNDTEDVVQLWKDCDLVVAWNDPYKDIRRKLDFQADLFFVAEIDDQLVGTVMAGYEGHRGWINYLATHPKHQRRGIGRKLMEFAEQRLLELNCPKINLQVRDTNTAVIDFYNAIGYKNDNVISFGKRLISDE